MATESLITPAHPPKRAKSRFWTVFALTYVSFLLFIAVIGGVVGQSLRARVSHTLQVEITRNLTQKAQMLANRINADHAHSIDVITSQEGQAAGARATVIDTNGTAVADSEVPVSSLAAEGHEPEFTAALRGSTGSEVRTRNGAQVLFVAVPVSGGAVRLAYPLADVETGAAEVTQRLLVGCLVAAVASAGLALLISRIVLSN
jgi:hypothetical protein